MQVTAAGGPRGCAKLVIVPHVGNVRVDPRDIVEQRRDRLRGTFVHQRVRKHPARSRRDQKDAPLVKNIDRRNSLDSGIPAYACYYSTSTILAHALRIIE